MIKAAVAGLTLIYPLLVYYGLAHMRPGFFGLVLLGLVILRIGGLQKNQQRRLLIPILLLMIYCIAIAITNNETLLRFYPVLLSIAMLAFFAHTLWRPPTMIERIARMWGVKPSEAASRKYMLRLTQLWCLFFIFNASIAAYTATQTSLKIWAIYNGLLSYVIMGALIGGEMIFRVFYKRRVAARKGSNL